MYFEGGIKMKIKQILFGALIICIIAIIPVVYAWGTGGGGGGGGTTGGGSSNILVDCGKSCNSGTYLFQLVYRHQNGGRDIVGCAVVSAGSHKGPVGDAQSKLYGAASGCKYIASGTKLNELAAQLYRGDQLDDLPVINDKETADRYIGEMGVDIDSLKQPGDEPGNINSYGYRILIQKLTCFGTSGNYCRQLWPRKDFANSVPLGLLFGGSWQDDLWTTKDDIGIHTSKYRSWHSTRGNCWDSGDMCDQLGRNFADWNMGEGYNIIGFNPDIFTPDDYSIDAVCSNCDSTSDNGSYLIQDTSSWDSILRSKDSAIKAANDYFLKHTCKDITPPKEGEEKEKREVYCREEFKITFPNANDKIVTIPGRYFTVNKEKIKWYADGIPNMKTIKVEKTRECMAKGEEPQACLQEFAALAKAAVSSTTNSVAGATGNIRLEYNESKETYPQSKYSPTIIEKMTLDKSRIEDTGPRYGGNTLTDTVTTYYKLDNNEELYRWVRIRDGLAQKSKPSDVTDHRDMGTANLPISSENYAKKDEGVVAHVKFKYSFPTQAEDRYTSLVKSFNKNNDYFQNPNGTADNIYKKYTSGQKLSDAEQQQLQNSACTQFGAVGSDAFNKCASERTENSAGNCYGSITGGASTDEYICDVYGCPKGKYYCAREKKCIDNSEPCIPYNCECVNGNNDCYDKEGQGPITRAEMNSRCNGGPDCPECKYVCECVNGDNDCYDKQGKGPITREEMNNRCDGGPDCPEGNCPTKGGNELIYRTIDLSNPFPGQTNYKRATGANWCTYNETTKKLNCAPDNPMVKQHILNNRKNEDESVYNLKPLYEVDLNPTIMRAIRDYNDTHEYDDFTLNCSGDVCYSTFLRSETTGLNLTGACSNKSRISTCAEEGR